MKIKKYYKGVISFVLAIVLMISSSTFASAEVKTDILVVLGDSIAYGYGIESPKDIYGNIIAEDRDYRLFNDAVSGDTTTDLLKIITENSVVKKNIQDAETVIISIGGNDFLHLGYESSITELLEIISKGRDSDVINTLVTTVEKNIHLIHESIRELNPKAKIVLQNVYNPFLGHKDRITQVLNDLVQIFRQDFIDIYNNEASTDSNMIIADVEKVFREYYEETNSTELIQSDFIHPSVKGHALIAETDEKAMDDVHKAGWSTLEKSASALLRLAERNVVENNAEETGTGTTE